MRRSEAPCILVKRRITFSSRCLYFSATVLSTSQSHDGNESLRKVKSCVKSSPNSIINTAALIDRNSFSFQWLCTLVHWQKLSLLASHGRKLQHTSLCTLRFGPAAVLNVFT